MGWVQEFVLKAIGPKAVLPAIGATTGMVYQGKHAQKLNVEVFRNWAKHSPWVRSIINIRKSQIAAADYEIGPYDVNRKYSKRMAQEITELFNHPNDKDRSFRAFITPVIDDILTLDAGAIEGETNMMGDLKRIWSVDGGKVRVSSVWDGNDPREPRYFWYPDGQQRASWRNDELAYMMMNPVSYAVLGISPLETLKLTIDAELNATDYNRRQVSSAPPEGLLNLGEGIPPDKAEQWRSFWLSEIAGKGAMGIIAGTKAPSWIPFRQTNRDMGFKEWQDYLVKQMVAVFGMSPQDVGMTFDINRACYSEDTQTLTDHGWKYYWEVDETDRIATYNPDSHKMEFHFPTDTRIYPYSGDMVQFKSRAVDVLVTPEHRMWVRRQDRSRTTKPWEKIEAQDLTDYRFTFLGSVDWEGERVEKFVLPSAERYSRGIEIQPEREIPMDDWLEFLGYVISEGCIFKPKITSAAFNSYRISISQKKPNGVEAIGRCLARLPFKFNSYVDSGGTTRWQVSDKALWIWLSTNVGHLSGDKKLPDMTKGLGTRQLTILFEAMMLGDGHTDPRPNNTGRAYSTKSERLADEVQELALKLGYRALIGKGSRVLTVVISAGNDHMLGRANISVVPYEGTVYCFEVPNHLFVTRRNGRVAIHGNTGDVQQELSEDRGLRPLADMIQDELTHQFVWHPSFGGPDNNLAFRFTRLNIRESLSKANINKIALAGVPWLTGNEARLDGGREPIGNLNDTDNPFNQILANTPLGMVRLTENSADIPTARELSIGSPTPANGTDQPGTAPAPQAKAPAPKPSKGPPKEPQAS